VHGELIRDSSKRLDQVVSIFSAIVPMNTRDTIGKKVIKVKGMLRLTDGKLEGVDRRRHHKTDNT
jgi:hypothetical protein